MPTQPNQSDVITPGAPAAADEAAADRPRVRVKHRRRRLRMPWEREHNGMLWLLLTLAIAAIMAYSMLYYLKLL